MSRHPKTSYRPSSRAGEESIAGFRGLWDLLKCIRFDAPNTRSANGTKVQDLLYSANPRTPLRRRGSPVVRRNAEPGGASQVVVSSCLLEDLSVLSWLPQTATEATTVPDVRYLRIDTPEKVQETVEVVVRILDERPQQVWRHWFGTRPLNCPGSRECPACLTRKRLREAGDPNWRETYRMEKRYLINIGLNGEVKIWSFGNKIGNRIAMYAERKELGDPRDYDLTIIKRRTGNAKLNIEYDVFPGVKTGVRKEHQALLSERHDLEAEIAPAAVEDIKEAMRINDPVPSKGASILQVAELQGLAQKKGFSLTELNIDVENLSEDLADKYIADLKSSS